MHYLVKHTAAITAFMLLAACQNISGPITTESTSAAPPANEVETSPREVVSNPSIRISDESSSHIETPITYTDLWQRMRAGFQLQEHYDHPNVARYLESYSNQQRYFDLMHERASPFLYWIVEEIDRRDLPLEFALLPMVESTYNPNAYSQEHAVGLWQFLGATGSSFGLQQDWWFDGRRDPYASTSAALDYMQQLYAQFNEDWLLAIAAYNTGDGNLRRAIRNSSSEDIYFWELNLPGETEAHIPKLLALAAIISDNENWGIELQALANEAVLDTVNVGTQIDMSQAAKLAELDYEELRALNPGYLQWATHPDQPQMLRLPPQNAKILSEALVGLDKTQLLTWDRYEIRPGDTLGSIARRLDTRVDILQTFNDLTGSRIVAGESLLIPRTMDSELLAAAPRVQRSRAREAVQVPREYSVRNGDNLWTIARRFDLRSTEIAAWNEIGLEELLQPGQILDFSYVQQSESEPPEEPQISGSASTYVVRRGDNMDAISRRFGIDLQNLLLWNGLSIDDLIFPGQELQVIPIESGSE